MAGVSARARTPQAERVTRRWIHRALPSAEELARTPLRRLPSRPLGRGTTPAALFEDDEGCAVLFRAMDSREIAAEELAQRVRAMGRRPHLPVARRTLELGDGDVRSGMVRPYLPDATPLPRDPAEYTPLDRGYLLREHPWEWLLANLDTHAGQYLRVGPARLPINIDWDRSLTDLHLQRLDRYTRRASVLVPAINRLYDLHATGELRLRFGGLWEQVGRASSLPAGPFADAVRVYAEATAHPDPERLVDAVLARQRALPGAFERLLSQLREERWRWKRSRGDGGLGVRLALAHAKDRAMRLALTEPPPRLRRQLLAAWGAIRRIRQPGLGR